MSVVSYDTKSGESPMRVYTGLTATYDYFNRELFGGQLPPCLITLQRHRGAYGYFAHRRFARLGSDERTDEIALNPALFKAGEEDDILSTLVHEMAHLWQYHFGKPSRAGYHNREWAAKMRTIGLIPSDTGKPDGAETGQRMSHYIDPEGPFARSCAAWLAQGPAVLYRDTVAEEPTAGAEARNRSKTKYTCPRCEINAWAKPNTNLVCGDCGEPMEAEEE